MPPNLLQHILAVHPRRSKGQQRVADHLYHNYGEAVFLTAAEIGAQAGVSTSTVTRLARRLGYRGFPEFQDALRDLVGTERSTVSRLERATAGTGDGQDVVAQVFASDLENLTRTQREADRDAPDGPRSSSSGRGRCSSSGCEAPTPWRCSCISPAGRNVLVTLISVAEPASRSKRLADFEQLWEVAGGPGAARAGRSADHHDKKEAVS